MSTADVPGLRERKKIKTREAVRREAFRLFQQNGYTNTTVEQIADAADVSPRTFFRYFPTKETVLVSDDLIEPIVEQFLAAPEHLSPVGAYRYAVEQNFTSLLSGDGWEYALERQRILYAVPEAKGALYLEYLRTIRLITEAMTQRVNAPADRFECQILAGAIAGVLMAATDDTPMSADAILHALDILDHSLEST